MNPNALVNLFVGQLPFSVGASSRARLTFRARNKMNIKSFPLKRRINRFEKNIPPNSIEIAQNNNYSRVIVVETFFVKKYFVCVESS